MGFVRHTSRVTSEGGCPLGSCPRCGSRLVQVEGWRELVPDRLMLNLRCPECEVRMVGSFDHDRIAAYDEKLVRVREQMESALGALVRRNMEELADCFAVALALDLIGPDDFVRRGTSPAGYNRARLDQR
jgi:DNA-directed RNA polymerase subunit RPC12/RpoP